MPPVHTKTWFHTGVYLGRARVSQFFAGLLDRRDVGEYFREPGLTDAQAKRLLLDDTVLPADLTFDEEREACRALRGAMLRQEIYAEDGSDKATHPYTVARTEFHYPRAAASRTQPPRGVLTHTRVKRSIIATSGLPTIRASATR